MEPTPFKTRLLFSGIFLAIFLSLFVLPARFFGIANPGYIQDDTPLTESGVLTSVNTDTDGDGVPNWQESLLGTNPENKDSDNNGIDDNTQYLEAKTYVATSTKSGQIYAASLARINDENNITSVFAKNSVSLTSYLSQQGATDQESLATAAQGMTDAGQKLAEPKLYTESSFRIQNTEGYTATKNYGNAVGAAFAPLFTKLTDFQEIQALTRYLTTKNVKDLAPLQAKITLVDTSISALLAISVPKSAKEHHLSLINTLSNYRNSLSNMNAAPNDPARALIGIRDYKTGLAYALSALESYRAYLDATHISFSPKEAGYIFSSSILTKI
jgi:hypothetical protein